MLWKGGLMTAIRTNDRVIWESPIFQGGSYFQGRFKGAKKIGVKRLSGVVLRHSYGEKTGQHTFTILLDDGTKKLVKGRNLYPNIIEHIVDYESPDRN
jgi:hypothetical protein